MSVTFFIAPFDPQLWRQDTPTHELAAHLTIDLEQYATTLRQQWPHLQEVHPPPDSPFPVYWHLNEAQMRGIEVQLNPNFPIVSFKRHDVNFVDFILWHRQFIPQDYPLFLFNDSGWPERLPLSPTTSRQAILDFCGMRESDKCSPLNKDGRWEGTLVLPLVQRRYIYTLSCTVFTDASVSGEARKFDTTHTKAEIGYTVRGQITPREHTLSVQISEMHPVSIGESDDPYLQLCGTIELWYDLADSAYLNGVWSVNTPAPLSGELLLQWRP
jgi:hypothetical protein